MRRLRRHQHLLHFLPSTAASLFPSYHHHPSSSSSSFSSNVTPAVSDAESILHLLSSSTSTTHPRRHLDDLLKHHKPNLTSSLVLDILTKYRQLGRSTTLEFFSWAGSHLGFRLDDAVVEYMADFLGRRKLFDDLRCLFTTVSSSQGRVPARAVAVCIRFLGRQGRVEEALSLFQTMESELNSRPSNLVFNNLLYVLCKKAPVPADFIEIALEVFRRIENPDVYSYSNIIIGLCRSGRPEMAVEVFQEMGSANLVPTRSAANILIGELCELGAKEELVDKVKVRNVRRPFDILVPNVRVKSGIEPVVEVFRAICSLGLLPSAFVVNQMVSHLCQLGMIEEMVGVLNVVGDRRLRRYEESCMRVVKALCRVRRMEEACHLFERMVSQGLKPKVVVYNSIICGFCKLGNMEEAEKFFETMSRMKCEPDGTTYTMLIHCYCGVGNLEAYGMLVEMIELGLHPHFHTYSMVDGLLKNSGRSDLSVKLEENMEVMVLLGHCKAGRLDAACEKLRSMVGKGDWLPIYIRDAFEQAFRRYGKSNMAQELLEKVDRVSSPRTS